MISLIICSRHKSLSNQLLENIDATIGILYEIIFINNCNNQYNIFQAYNIGVKKSKFPYLCFMHDDILYKTKDWGQNTIKHFDDEKLGAIGVAGSPYLAAKPSGWWSSGHTCINILQSSDDKCVPTLIHKGGEISSIEKVVVLDGVWICIRKKIFDEICFDEKKFDSYHFYDTDICSQIYKLNYKLYCVYDILLQHFSEGKICENWIKSSLVFQDKWKQMLPISILSLSYRRQCQLELNALKQYITFSKQYYSNYKSNLIAIKYVLKYPKGYFHYQTVLFLYMCSKVIFLHHIKKTFFKIGN